MSENKLVELVSVIREGSIICIEDCDYNVKAKAKYNTKNNPDTYYYKIFLDNHFVLVIATEDEFLYFGKDVGDSGIKEPFNKKVLYKNSEYKKLVEDFQVLNNIEFGIKDDAEGDLAFWDYECVNDENKIISIGILKENKKRSDIVGNVISINNIIIK